MHLRSSITAATTLSLALLGSATLVAVSPAEAVNANHGNQIVSAMPTPGTPHVMNGAVEAITQVGTKIIVAGTFTSVSPAATFTDTSDDLVRNRMFAFDATTGAIDTSFNPNFAGEVRSLATDGTNIYASGAFGSVGGMTAYKRVVKLDASGAVADQFKVTPSAVVNEVVYRSGRVYIGGGFQTLKSRGVVYNVDRLAVLDPTMGTPNTTAMNFDWSGVYNPSATNPGTTNVKRFDVTADGSRLAAIGNFTTISGTTRNQIAMFDVSGATTTLTSFATNRFDRSHSVCSGSFDTFTRDLDFSPDGSFLVVSTTGAFGGGANANSLCDTTSRWETSQTTNDPTWIDYTGGDTSYGVAVTGNVVYIGGHMRYENNPFQGDQAGPGAVAREGIAALDPVNGLPLSWNPGRPRGVGAQALFATSQGLWVGSDTTLIAGQRRGRIALMPLAGGKMIPNVAPATLPNDLFLASQPPGTALLRRPVGSTGIPTASATTVNTTVNTMDWSSVRGAFYLNGTVYYGLSTGGVFKRTFNPTTFALGAQQTVDLHNDPDTGQAIPWSITGMTGMFYDSATHRIYYTVSGDSHLYYRYFTPESDIVGAWQFTGDSGGNVLNNVAGMTFAMTPAGGRVLYGASDGTLRSAPFSGGRITGLASVVSSDGTWKYRAMFVRND
jgi:hypothetical protein